jgi:hypothetical protein
MKRCEYGMMINHPGTGVMHHRLYLFSHGRPLAMDAASGARCFAFLERTPVETLSCIILKLSAFIAKPAVRFMHSAAVNLYYSTYGLFFPDHPAFPNHARRLIYN